MPKTRVVIREVVRKKKTQRKRKVKKTRKNRKPKMSGQMPIMRGMQAHKICSISNPFCPQAIGARWPDNSYAKSVSWSATGLSAPLATDANGNFAALFFPSLNYTSSGGTVTAGTYAVAYTSRSGNFTPPANIVRWRLTSWGIKLQCVSTQMNTTGVVRIRLVSPYQYDSLTSTSATSPFADAVLDIPAVSLINEPVHIIPMPLGDNARLFQLNDPSAFAGTINPGWQVVQVGITGAQASTTVLEASLYYNFELVFSDGSALAAFTIAPPENDPHARDGSATVLHRVGNFVAGNAHKVDQRFIEDAMDVAGSTAVGFYTGGPVGAAMGAGSAAFKSFLRRYNAGAERPAITVD